MRRRRVVRAFSVLDNAWTGAAVGRVVLDLVRHADTVGLAPAQRVSAAWIPETSGRRDAPRERGQRRARP